MVTYHDIPYELLWLGVEGFVPGSNGDLLGHQNVKHFHLQGPEAPTPVFAVLVGLLGVVQRAHVPSLPTIQCNLHTCHFLATSCNFRKTA